MVNRLYMILKKNNIQIEEDDFFYGANVLKRYIIFCVLMLPILFIFDTFFITISFLVPYIYLRHYLGGIHLENSNLCTFFSILICLCIPMLYKLFSYLDLLHIILIYAICIYTLYRLKIAVHCNKPLSEQDIRYFTNVALKTELFYLIISGLLYFTEYNLIGLEICIATSLCTLEIAIVKIKSYFYKNKL